MDALPAAKVFHALGDLPRKGHQLLFTERGLLSNSTLIARGWSMLPQVVPEIPVLSKLNNDIERSADSKIMF